MIIYQKRIYRVDLRANPNVLYVFGDNLLRVGLGGQAGEMRGEPNAVGVATKKSPGMKDEDFFTDDEYDFNIQSIRNDLSRIRKVLEYTMGPVVFPLDGIGTGLSDMPNRCPRTFQYLKELNLGGK